MAALVKCDHCGAQKESKYKRGGQPDGWLTLTWTVGYRYYSGDACSHDCIVALLRAWQKLETGITSEGERHSGESL